MVMKSKGCSWLSHLAGKPQPLCSWQIMGWSWIEQHTD